MNIERKRWAQRAHQHNFEQLAAVRKQAEGWRTGLAGLTALLGAVLIVKGRDNISDLVTGFQWAVAVMIGLALASLVSATLLAVRASWGAPGGRIRMTGENLELWTEHEVAAVGSILRWAACLSVLGVALVAVAIGITWLGPARKQEAALMDVQYQSGRVCGELVGISGGTAVLKDPKSGRPSLIPVSGLISVTPTKACS